MTEKIYPNQHHNNGLTSSKISWVSLNYKAIISTTDCLTSPIRVTFAYPTPEQKQTQISNWTVQGMSFNLPTNVSNSSEMCLC